jgi:hypothetical protein
MTKATKNLDLNQSYTGLGQYYRTTAVCNGGD